MIYNLKIEQEKQDAISKLNTHIENGVVISLSNETKRSIRQNAYFHVIASLYAIEYGNRLEDSKDYFKCECPFVEDNVETSKMTVDEMQSFTDWVVTYCNTIGLNLPSNKEWMANRAAIDKEISKSQKYL